jgi:heme A synthase
MTTVVLDPATVNDLLALHPANVALGPQSSDLALAVLVALIVLAFGLSAAIRVMLAVVAQMMRPMLRLARIFVVTVVSAVLLGAMLMSRPAGAERHSGPTPTVSPTSTAGPSVAAPRTSGPASNGQAETSPGSNQN